MNTLPKRRIKGGHNQTLSLIKYYSCGQVLNPLTQKLFLLHGGDHPSLSASEIARESAEARRSARDWPFLRFRVTGLGFRVEL